MEKLVKYAESLVDSLGVDEMISFVCSLDDDQVSKIMAL